MSDWPIGLTLRPTGRWPVPMTKNRKRSRFDSTLSQTTTMLSAELRHLRAENPVMQIALEEKDFRIDGMPRAHARPEHPGVILSMNTPHCPISMPCDTFTTWQDNLRAITLSLNALRTVDRYGVTRRGEQYTGWTQIEAGPDLALVQSALNLLAAVTRTEKLDAESQEARGQIKHLFRAASRASHPDTGGDREQWERVSQAGDVLRKARFL